MPLRCTLSLATIMERPYLFASNKELAELIYNSIIVDGIIVVAELGEIVGYFIII